MLLIFYFFLNSVTRYYRYGDDDRKLVLLQFRLFTVTVSQNCCSSNSVYQLKDFRLLLTHGIKCLYRMNHVQSSVTFFLPKSLHCPILSTFSWFIIFLCIRFRVHNYFVSALSSFTYHLLIDSSFVLRLNSFFAVNLCWFFFFLLIMS